MIRFSRRVAVLAAGGAVVASAVSGCGASDTPQSALPSQLTPGVNLQIPQDTSKPPQMLVRNLFVLGPATGRLAAGSTVPVYASLINSAGAPDALGGVSSSAAAGGQITGNTLALPVGKAVSLNGGTVPIVVLTGLQQSLYGGQRIPLTLSFANAGTVTVSVPVVPAVGAYATYPAAPSLAPLVHPVPTLPKLPATDTAKPLAPGQPTGSPTPTPVAN